jgi:hypothetical protein
LLRQSVRQPKRPRFESQPQLKSSSAEAYGPMRSNSRRKMLEHVVLWMQIFETFLEFLLLGRMLLLRMQRVYLYITLYAIVTVALDACSLIVGIDSDPGIRIFLYSRFLFILVYPLVAWDVFEEGRPDLLKLRRVHLPRMVSGIFITLLIGFASSFGIDDQDYKGTSTMSDFMGLFIWLGAASTSLLFTWNVFRTARKTSIELPHNTFVWAIFFLITFARAVIDCGFDVADSLFPHMFVQIADLVFTIFDVCLVAWCTLKLKPLPGDITTTPEKARL